MRVAGPPERVVRRAVGWRLRVVAGGPCGRRPRPAGALEEGRLHLRAPRDERLVHLRRRGSLDNPARPGRGHFVRIAGSHVPLDLVRDARARVRLVPAHRSRERTPGVRHGGRGPDDVVPSGAVPRLLLVGLPRVDPELLGQAHVGRPRRPPQGADDVLRRLLALPLEPPPPLADEMLCRDLDPVEFVARPVLRLGSMNALVPVRPNLKQSLHEFT